MQREKIKKGATSLLPFSLLKKTMPPLVVSSKTSNAAIKIRGVTVYRPFIYGNVAVRLTPEEKVDVNPDHTHKWTVAVRGVGGDEDVSYFIKKVVFKLHETYTNPSRSIEAPPFEVTETGWGEFEIGVKIYFTPEANEKPLSLTHHLKLHPWPQPAVAEDPQAGGAGETTAQQPPVSDEPVHSWQYDEVAFHEPNESMYTLLLEHAPASLPPSKLDENGPGKFSVELENEEAHKLESARAEVMSKVEELRKRLVDGDAELAKLKADIEKLTQPESDAQAAPEISAEAEATS